MSWNNLLIVYLTAVNLVALLLYGIDKWKAIRHKWRIPERTLLLIAWIGGAAGAWMGMCIFHHKTRKWKFRILVPAALAVWCAVLYFCR